MFGRYDRYFTPAGYDRLAEFLAGKIEPEVRSRLGLAALKKPVEIPIEE